MHQICHQPKINVKTHTQIYFSSGKTCAHSPGLSTNVSNVKCLLFEFDGFIIPLHYLYIPFIGFLFGDRVLEKSIDAYITQSIFIYMFIVTTSPNLYIIKAFWRLAI